VTGPSQAVEKQPAGSQGCDPGSVAPGKTGGFREFLGLGPADTVPNHSCVSKTHKRLPKDVFDEVFGFIVTHKTTLATACST